jgi:hypothetical protein
MNQSFVFGRKSLVLLICSLGIVSAPGQITKKDTVVPNIFEFSQSDYYVTKGATSAWITIRFTPGHRGFYGTVAFKTEDGSGIAQQDYVHTEGDVRFSWVLEQQVEVPLLTNATDEVKTIRLILAQSSSDASAVITRSNAMLHVNILSPPELVIKPAGNGLLRIGWPEDGTTLVLERRNSFADPNWAAVTTPVNRDGAGNCFVEEDANAGLAMYRLRRGQ